MSQLAQIRQHVKTIETIKKITHAMRLISMSTHSQLKHKEEPLEAYNKAIDKLFHRLVYATPQWQHPVLLPKSEEERRLVIVIGSQKGLCGSFNSTLFTAFKNRKALHTPSTHYIAIGRKAVDFMHTFCKSENGTMLNAFPTFTNKTRINITHKLLETITTAEHPYTHVSIISNKLKTFFVQKPEVTKLIPLVTQEERNRNKQTLDYLWEQSPEEVMTHVSTMYLEAKIEHVLFQSLFAEHAARFVSMDTATRNAESILDITRLKYNKLRQAEITKELTELTGSNL